MIYIGEQYIFKKITISSKQTQVARGENMYRIKHIQELIKERVHATEIIAFSTYIRHEKNNFI